MPQPRTTTATVCPRTPADPATLCSARADCAVPPAFLRPPVGGGPDTGPEPSSYSQDRLRGSSALVFLQVNSTGCSPGAGPSGTLSPSQIDFPALLSLPAAAGPSPGADRAMDAGCLRWQSQGQDPSTATDSGEAPPALPSKKPGPTGQPSPLLSSGFPELGF